MGHINSNISANCVVNSGIDCNNPLVSIANANHNKSLKNGKEQNVTRYNFYDHSIRTDVSRSNYVTSNNNYNGNQYDKQVQQRARFKATDLPEPMVIHEQDKDMGVNRQVAIDNDVSGDDDNNDSSGNSNTDIEELETIAIIKAKLEQNKQGQLRLKETETPPHFLEAGPDVSTVFQDS